MEKPIAEAAEIVWGTLPTLLIIAAGLFLCVKIRFSQLTRLGRLPAALAGGSRKKLSAFEMFALTTGGKVGVGNIVGVSVALAAGGAGAIFWMGVYAIIGAGVAYYECRKGAQCGGGPPVYMRQLGWKKAAALFSGLVFCVEAVFMPAIQMNSAAAAAEALSGSKTAALAAAGAAALAFLALSRRGEKATARAGAKLMPAAVGVYMLLAVAVIAVNYKRLPAALWSIFSGAFGLRPAAGGLLGAMSVGVRRGMFSGEAGYGIAPYAAAKAGGDPEDIGLVQGFSVIFDTLIMCGITALMLLTAGTADAGEAAACVLGGAGRYFIAAEIWLFAFTTLLCCGFTAAAPFSGAKRAAALLLTAGVSVAAAGMTPAAVWPLCDIAGGLMAWLNIAALVAGEVKKKGRARDGVKNKGERL